MGFLFFQDASFAFFFFLSEKVDYRLSAITPGHRDDQAKISI